MLTFCPANYGQILQLHAPFYLRIVNMILYYNDIMSGWLRMDPTIAGETLS